MSETAATSFAIGRVGRSAALVTVAVGLGQIFGIGRELFVASQVGTTGRLDALLVALVVPTMLSGMLVSGTSTALVPAYAAIERESGVGVARRFMSVVITWTLLVGILATIAVVAAGTAVIGLAGPGLSPQDQAAGTAFLVVVAPIIVLGSMAGLLSAVCQVAGRFGPISVAQALGPVASFIVTVGAWPTLGLAALALGMTALSGVTMVVLLIGALRYGLLARPGLRARRSDARSFIRHALPLWVGSLTLQLNTFVDRAISTILAVGAVSALRFGEGIVRIPLTSIGPAWGMVLYPALVREAQGGTRESLGLAALTSFRYVFGIFIPISVATAAMAPLIVDVAYLRGAFGTASAQATTGVAAALAPMIVVTMVEAIVISAHNAQRRGTLLLAAGIANTVVHLVLAVVLGLSLGVAGVALSTSITMALILALLTVRLAQTDPSLDLGAVTRCGLRALVASMVPAVPIAIWCWGFYATSGFALDLLALVALTLVGFATYLLVATRIGLGEPVLVVRTLLHRLPGPFGSVS